MEQELIYSNKNGALHKRPRLTKLTEARKKAGYKSQYEIAKDLGITQTEYCSYESGKKEMPKRIADKLSALLNMPVKEIKSVDYASVNLSDDAVKLLNKIFKLIGDLREGYVQELDKQFTEIHKVSGFANYYHSFRNQLLKMPKKKSNKIQNQFNKEDFELLFGRNTNKKMALTATIHYDSMELLLDNGLLKENQLKDFIKYFNIIQ